VDRGFFCEGPDEKKNLLEYQSTDGRIILKLIVKKWYVVHELDLSSSRCDYGNKPSVSTKCR
jgi:hypothetical protein